MRHQMGNLRRLVSLTTDRQMINADDEMLLRDMERYKQLDEQRQMTDGPGPSGREEVC